MQGDPDGVPVLVLHGTPGSRFSGTPPRDTLTALGQRVVTFDRPGYGDTPLDEARPVSQLAGDALAALAVAGVEGPVGVLAASGGAATALALAVAHPERVAAMTLVMPTAPRAEAEDSPGMSHWEWVRGMDDQQQGLHRLALQDPVYLRDQLEQVLGPEAGAAGIVNDMVEVQEPWGLDPADVTCHVDLWWSDDDSGAAPAGHARWLAEHLTGAEVEQHPLDGHAWPTQRLVEIFDRLGERLGARRRTDDEIAALAAAEAAGGGCGDGAAGGCMCGAGGCG